eukprot:1783354-Rhodomonas_salina.1
MMFTCSPTHTRPCTSETAHLRGGWEVSDRDPLVVERHPPHHIPNTELAALVGRALVDDAR